MPSKTDSLSHALVFEPVASVLNRFKAKTLSPVEYLEALLKHIEHLNPALNSLSEQYVDEARLQAKNAEAAYWAGEPKGALAGIPFSVKDSLQVKDKKCTSGSYTKLHIRCEESEPCIDRLTGAGAILHARTTCPEFSWAWTCHSKLNGLTLNPWNKEVTCGGSCGGAAASLAAGLSPLSLGADSAGSIRMPSSMCGVIGYKPPFGRNPVSTAYCEDGYNVVGPMARTVEDCRLMQNILNGQDPRDPNTLHPSLQLDPPGSSLKGLRVGFSIDMGFFRIAEDVKRNTEKVLRFLESQGAIVEPVAIDWAREAYDKADAYGDFLAQDAFKNALEQYPKMLSDYTYHFAELSLKTTLADYIGSYQNMYKSWQKFSPIISRYDCFICPTVATTEVPVSFRPWDKMVIQNQEVDRWVLTLLFSVFRFCPALAVPSGLAGNGVPTGIQIVGKPLDDAMVFKIGNAVDREFGFFASRKHLPEVVLAAEKSEPHA